MGSIDQRALRLEFVKYGEERTRSLMEQHNARWVLGLTLANAGAFLALAGRILEVRSEALTALCMPSCWMFVVGLAAAGVINPVAAFRATRATNSLAEDYISLLENEHYVAPEFPPDVRIIYWVEFGLEAVSGLSFLVGVTYPLAVICHRYLTSGSGFF